VDLGDNIRNVRLHRGYSQEYVAQRLGISQNSYSKIERGEIALTKERLKLISDILSVSPEDVIEFDERTLKQDYLISVKSRSYSRSEQALINEMRSYNKSFRSEIARFIKLIRKMKGDN
tara:strand:+ start:649 stop:1005 length:357 start_codon:yes stop_codon:yes gene_type:complete